MLPIEVTKLGNSIRHKLNAVYVALAAVYKYMIK